MVIQWYRVWYGAAIFSQRSKNPVNEKYPNQNPHRCWGRKPRSQEQLNPRYAELVLIQTLLKRSFSVWPQSSRILESDWLRKEEFQPIRLLVFLQVDLGPARAGPGPPCAVREEAPTQVTTQVRYYPTGFSFGHSRQYYPQFYHTSKKKKFSFFPV